MPITETIKKGKIKRKVSDSAVEVLMPETDAYIVNYDNTTVGDYLDNLTASQVKYVNTTSELTATDVQAAIDELAVTAGKIDTISFNNSALPIVNKDVNINVDGTYNASTNKIASVSTITNAIQGLDVNEFKLTETNTTTNVVTLHGIKETDGKIAVGTTSGNDVTFYNKTGTDNAISTAINALDVPASGTGAITGFGAGKTLATLTETDGKIAATFQNISITSSQISDKTDSYSATGTVAVTGKAIAAALGTLDTSANVAPAVVSGSGSAQKITFKDIKETDGIIAAGSNITSAVTYTDGAIDTLLGNKVDKRTSGNEVYTHSGTTQGGITYGTTATPNYIVQRDSGGHIMVPDNPTGDGQAVNKKYVDSKITQGAEYLGVVDDTTELYALDSSAGEGDWVRVGTQFTYSSETCHVGDILICSAAKGSATHATWDVIHTEVDTDTNTTYQAIVGAAGTGYAGTILLQKKELGQSSYTTQDTIKFINGNGISITPDATNKTLTIGHSNSITAQTTAKVFKTKIDAQGHVTEATQATSADVGVTLTTTAGSEAITATKSGGSDTLHVVTTDTAQTITGEKTFENKIKLNWTDPTETDIDRTSQIIADQKGLTAKNMYVGEFEYNFMDGNSLSTPGVAAIKLSGSSYMTTRDYRINLAHTNSSLSGVDWYSLKLPLVGSIDSPAILATTDYVVANGSGTASTALNKLQVNGTIYSVGDVKGPSSATANAIAVYDETTGKKIKSSYLTVSANKITGATGSIDLSSNLSFGTSISYIALGSGSLYAVGNFNNLGNSTYKWTDLYLSGNLSDGTNSIAVANIGNVKGPASAYVGNIAIYDNANGKVIGDSGWTATSSSLLREQTGLFIGTNPFGSIGVSKSLAVKTVDSAYVYIARTDAVNTMDYAFYAEAGKADLGYKTSTVDRRWRDLYLSGSLKDGNGNEISIANIVAGATTNVKSGQRYDSSTSSWVDINGSKSGTVITLGDSGIGAGWESGVKSATYSAVQVNAKGIVIGGGQVLDVIAHGGTPNVVNGGWYFEESASA